jgi:hypothetical protein
MLINNTKNLTSKGNRKMKDLTKEQKIRISVMVSKYQVYIPKNELEIIFQKLSDEFPHLNYWDMREYIDALDKQVCL